MILTLSDVKHIANLSCLELTEIQANETLEKLNNIFMFIEQIKIVDTTEIEPLHHPVVIFYNNLSLQLRDDIVVTDLECSITYQKFALSMQDGLYLVPKVIK